MSEEQQNQEQFLSKFSWMQYEDDPRWQSLTKKNQEGEIWRKAIKDQFGNKNFDKLMLAIGTPDARRFMSDEAKTKFTIDYMHQPNGLSEAVKFATIGLLTAGVGSGLVGTVGTTAKAIGRTLSATKTGKLVGKAAATIGDFSKKQWGNFLKTSAGQGLNTAGQTVKASLPAAGIYLGLKNYYSPEGYRKTQELFNETVDSYAHPTSTATRLGNIAKTVKSGLGDIVDLSMPYDLKAIAPQLEFGIKNAYDVLKRTKITMPKNTLSCGFFPSIQTIGTPDKDLYKFVSDASLGGGFRILNTKTNKYIGFDEIMPALFAASKSFAAMGNRGAKIAKIGIRGKDVFFLPAKTRIPKEVNKDDIILDVSNFLNPDMIVDGKNIKFTTNIEDLENYLNNINSSTSGLILFDKYGKEVGKNRTVNKKLQDTLKIIHENVTKPGGSLNDAFGNGVKIAALDKDFIRNNIDYVQIGQDLARNNNVAIENGKIIFKNNIIPADSELHYIMHGFEPYFEDLTKQKDFWFSPFTKETTSILPLNYVKLLSSMTEDNQLQKYLAQLFSSNNSLKKALFNNNALQERQYTNVQTLDYIRQVLKKQLGSNYHVHARDMHSVPDMPKIYKDPIPLLGKSVGINPIIYSSPEAQTAIARVLQRMTADAGGSMAFGGIKSGLYYTPNPIIRYQNPVHYSSINQYDQYPNAFSGKALNTSSLNFDQIIGPIYDTNNFNLIPRNLLNREKFINVDPQIIKEALPTTSFDANIAHTSYGNPQLILRRGGILK